MFFSLCHIQLFETPWSTACQASLSYTISQSLLKLTAIESMMPSNHLILCFPLLLLLSIFPSVKVLSSESSVHIRRPKYSFSISPSNDIQGWFPEDWLVFDLLLSKELSRVLSSTTVQKHQFFGAHPSLWSNSHILTGLQEKPYLWLYRPL